MSPKRPREAANLFAAAGMEQDAPHPLPDRLRPRALAEVVGQDLILGPDGAPAPDVYARSDRDLDAFPPATTVGRPVLRVVGVGGAGVNAVNRMV